MTVQSTSPFGDGCCTTPGTSCVVNGTIGAPGDSIVVPLGQSTLLATVQIEDLTTGTLDFNVSLDGITWYPLTMVQLQPGTQPPAPTTTMNGIYQAPVAGWAQLQIIAESDFAGPAAQVLVRLTDVAPGNAGINGAITWERLKFTLTGGNDWLLTPDPARRAFMLYSPIGNSPAMWNPVGDSMPTINDGIPLVPGAAPTVFTFPECGASYVTCTGTSGDIITVWRGY